MIKKLFPFLSVIMLALFVGACSSEDVMPNIDQGASSRTVTFEALMPGGGPTTRVVAEELADRSIDLTWEANDEIVLLFVQGAVEENATATVVSADGKTGTFTVTLPTGISETEDYTIYGVYGSAGVPTGDKAIVNLPSTGELGKKILLRFEKAVSGNAIGSVEFAHTGYLFTAKVAITGGTVNDINLVADEGWAISSSAYTFNLKEGTFKTTATAANSIDLEYFVNEDGVATAKSWFPATEEKLPALRLSVNGTVETADAKPARTPNAGQAYYLYADYDGAELVFDTKGTIENPYTVAEAFDAQGEKDNKRYVWVKGYIVGYKNNGGYDVDFGTEGASGTNIIIADNKEEADATNALGVQLPSGTARTELNLASNPTMYKAEVLLKGTLEAYFGADEGLKNVKEYVLISANPFFITDVTEVELAASGDAITGKVTINTNEDQAWNAATDASWLTVTAAGTGGGDVTLTAEVNTGAERVTEVTLTPTGDKGLTPIVVTVTQVATGEAPKGTKDNPYTVAEAIAKQGETDVWVKGFIVGSFNSGSIFGTENASEFNLTIADDKDAIEGADIVNVQLTTTNNIRADLNLKNNSDKYKAEVLFRGDLVKYNNLPGIKNTKEYELVTEGGTDPTPDPIVFTVDIHTVLFNADTELASTVKLTTDAAQAWTVASSASWLTPAPASGSGNADIVLTATENTAEAVRTATVTITPTANADLTPIVVNVTQLGTVAPPAELLFPGADFDNWTTFLSSLSTHGLTFGKESATGGIDGSGAMQLEGQHGSNAYVFTAVVPEGFSAVGKTMIHFWVKGTSVKSLSMNVYVGPGDTMGTDYKTFNMDEYVPYNSHQVLEPKNSNSYAKGGIDTGGAWIKVSLDISTLDINTTPGQNLFALKIGSKSDYNLLVDDITIE